MNIPKVLYLTYDGLTDPLGQSQILPYLIGLSRQGYDITVVSCEKPGAYRRRKTGIAKQCADVGLEWHPLPYTKSPPVASTLGDLKRMKAKAAELHAEKPFDLIHCRSYLPVLIALTFKKAHGLPYVFDMRGFWADERVDGNIWDLKNPVHRRVYEFFKKREPRFLEEAAAVVSLTHAAKKEIRERFVSDPHFGGGELRYNFDKALETEAKTTVIPCATDLGHFDPGKVSQNKLRWLGAKYGLDPTTDYLGYVGSLGTWYMGGEMLRLYRAIAAKHPEARFLVLSQDDPEPWLALAEKLGIGPSRILHITAERRDVPGLMTFMRAAVFFILPVYSKMASSPVKQGELMAMGVPVICNAGVGDTAEIVKKYRSGHVTQGFSDDDFAEIAGQWDDITALDKDLIRGGALEYYDLKRGVERYAAVYERVTGYTAEAQRLSDPSPNTSR